MPIFREHRASLSASCETCVIVHSKEDILNKLLKGPYGDSYRGIDVDCINIENYGFDRRIGWFSQIVVLKSKYENINGRDGVLGFLSEPLACDDGIVDKERGESIDVGKRVLELEMRIINLEMNNNPSNPLLLMERRSNLFIRLECDVQSDIKAKLSYGLGRDLE